MQSIFSSVFLEFEGIKKRERMAFGSFHSIALEWIPFPLLSKHCKLARRERGTEKIAVCFILGPLFLKFITR